MVFGSQKSEHLKKRIILISFVFFLPCANLQSGELTLEEKKQFIHSLLNFAEKSVTKGVLRFVNPIVKL